ncbi:hypothetical protein MBLNU230_g3761t1 [Neophaeotheca triangularis]
MKVGKPKSKRTPTRLRHKIEKASNAKQRKERKEAKKNPQWQSRLKKDPGIPNLFPFKAKMLEDLEEGRRQKEAETQRKREVAKAQRQGLAVADADGGAKMAEADDDELVDDAEDFGSDDEMDEGDSSNPMAALLASAQARAQNFPEAEDSEEVDESDEEEGGAVVGVDKAGSSAPGQATKKALPKQALADPIKTVSKLVDRMQQVEGGVDAMLNHYNIPPLVTAGSDLNTRYLVDVARKTGRLGKGGVPNLHSAALTVLTDINEERLKLPVPAQKSRTTGKGEVQIVSQMAEPFSIEGLFANPGKSSSAGTGGAMVVDS